MVLALLVAWIVGILLTTLTMWNVLSSIRATLLSARILALNALPVIFCVRLPVARRGTDFEFVQLVPFLVGAIPVRDSHQFANPAAGVKR